MLHRTYFEKTRLGFSSITAVNVRETTSPWRRHLIFPSSGFHNYTARKPPGRLQACLLPEMSNGFWKLPSLITSYRVFRSDLPSENRDGRALMYTNFLIKVKAEFLLSLCFDLNALFINHCRLCLASEHVKSRRILLHFLRRCQATN